MNGINYSRRINYNFLLICMILIASILCGYQRFSPSSDWVDSPTGSAKYLDGSTVLVSLFIEDSSSSWSDDKKEIVMSKMDLANDFLVSEGNSYGKSVNLIYDIYEHPDLSYMVSYSGTIDDSNRASYQLLEFITRYIDNEIPTQEILASYNVDSIAYMCFLDKSGVSFTFPYYEGDSDLYYYETCYMFLKCDGDYEPPAVYAHEILHLFGARDLYSTNQSDGITKEFVQHIEQDYPNEIMLTTYDENWNNVQDHVSNEITDITAYYIGWLEEIPELETYPSIYYPYTASFGDVNDDTGNYTDYSAGDSDNPDSHWGSDSNSGWGNNSGNSGSWGSKTGSTDSDSGSRGGNSNNTTAPVAPDNSNSHNNIFQYIWNLWRFLLDF